jgi:hypothetical protein
MATKNLFLLLFLAGLPVGCTTVKSYVPQTEPGPAKPADYPIYIYNEKTAVPRPAAVIGTMSIRDTPFTMFGGSLESELQTLQENARRRGADALKLTAVEQPDFLHAKYRVTADFLRFTNAWENLALLEQEFRTYLDTPTEPLDPIEGIWVVNDKLRSRVGIIRNNVRPGRDFIAFILNTSNPTWQPGDKKLELASGERPGVYRGLYCFDDYRRKAVAFTLMGARTNVFILPMPNDDPPIIFSKE